MQTQGIVWHYTVRDRLSQIIADGVIRQATAGIGFGERPAVWFSSHPSWEPTANKGIIGRDGSRRTATKAEMQARGMARIGVERNTAPHDWEAFKRLSGVSNFMASCMKRAGLDAGAKMSQWFVSFDPVPRERWVSVEVWNGSDWEAYAVPGKSRILLARLCSYTVAFLILPCLWAAAACQRVLKASK